MTGAGPGLTPELAVDYLRELSADIRAAACSRRTASRSPGRPELGGRRARLLAAAPDAAEIEVAVAGGAVHAARGEHHAVVAVCGRYRPAGADPLRPQGRARRARGRRRPGGAATEAA